MGQIVLSRLSSCQIDGGKDLFHPGLMGIKADGEKVLPGVIGYCDDTPKGGDGGAHGVDGSSGGLSDELLEFGKDLFDGIQIG